MGEFVSIDSNSKEKHKWGVNQKHPEKIFLQLIPAVVTDVIMHDNHPAYQDPSSINCILAKPHLGTVTSGGYKQLENTIYTPLMRGMCDTPVKGDSVLLLSNTAGTNYFLGPLNSTNNPNYNIDPLNREIGPLFSKRTLDRKSKLNIPTNYSLTQAARLQTPYIEELDNRRKKRVGEDGSIARTEVFGDMIMEGRFGNSIRIGYNDNSPKIVISNGRNGRTSLESLYDGSIFSMTSHGSLKQHFHNFSLSSDVVEGQTRFIGNGNIDETQNKFNYDFGTEDNGDAILRNQIFMSSDKITFNS